MDQDTPTPGGFGTQSGSDMGTTGTGSSGSMGSSVSGGGFGAGTGTGTGSGMDTGAGTGICPHCGQSLNRGLEQFLGRIGISEDMVNNLKSQFQNVDVEQYLNTAREYLKNSSDKATSFAKENPGKVAAGVAVLAVGAGLLISAMNKD